MHNAGRTVGDLLDAWLTHSESSGKSRRYIAENRRAIDNYLRLAIGGIRLERLTVADIDGMLAQWARDGRLTGATMRRYLAPLRAALGQARRWGWRADNPAELATIPRGRASADPLTPTPEEFAALVRKAAERGDWPMVTAIRLAYVTSARRGELAAMRWSDFDLDAGSVTIARSADRYGNEGPTKTRQKRTVQLDAGTVAMLRERQRDKGGEHVIGLRADQITDRFRKLVAMTPGVRHGVRFHDQRHAGASEMLAAGVPVTAVAARLGHASSRTTMQVYAHALPGADDGAAAIMGELAAGDDR
jgi:integrase